MFQRPISIIRDIANSLTRHFNQGEALSLSKSSELQGCKPQEPVQTYDTISEGFDALDRIVATMPLSAFELHRLSPDRAALCEANIMALRAKYNTAHLFF